MKSIAEKLQQLTKDRACRYRFHASTSTRFEVMSGITMVDYLVDLEARTCSCHAWQSSGYPCGHALASIMALKRNPQLYSKTFFTLESYRKSYEHSILHPLAGDYSQPLVWPSELSEDPKSVAFAAQESQKPLLVVSIVRIIVDVAGVLDIQKGLAGRLFNYYLIYLIHN